MTIEVNGVGKMASVAVEARRIFFMFGGDLVVAAPRGVVETTCEDAMGRTVGLLGRANTFIIFLRLGACFVVAAVAAAEARGVVARTGRTVGLVNAFTNKSVGAVMCLVIHMDVSNNS